MKKYDQYKNSGVEWLGEIPKHWEVKKLKLILKERNEKNNPIITNEVLSLSMHKGVTKYSDKGRGGNKAKDDLKAYKIARANDIVLNSMNIIVGSVGLSKFFGAISPVYYALFARNEDVNINFYDNLFQNQSFQMSLFPLGNGILIKKSESSNKLNTIRLKISIDDLNNVLLPFPPRNEQISIVKFLKDKTTKIDQAIRIKQEQIELLKERRQIITHKALKLGLNPKIEFCESGIGLIGKIPKHWQIKKVKYLLSERNERSKNGLEPLFMMSQTHGLVVRSEYHLKAQVAQSSEGNKVVYKNDLVFNKLKAHLGVFFKSTIDFNGIVSPDYAVYFSTGEIKDLKFLELLFRNPEYIKEFICRATGIVEGLIRLYTADLFDIYVAVPPLEEQIQILAYIENVTTKIATAISLKEKEIEKLKEYKMSLIDGVVTGKVRVC